MMQSGLSRELFEKWCENPKNTCLVAGYCCENTLAKHILSEPDEIMTMDGQKIPRKCKVEYISFSAHADYRQTSEFVRALHPPQIILVHGESNEMNKLKQGLTDQYKDDEKNPITIHNPKNLQAVELHFREEKTAKVIGNLAVDAPKDGKQLSGVLVKRNFNYHLMDPEDVRKYTNLSVSSVSQTLSVGYKQTLEVLQQVLETQEIPFEHVEVPVKLEGKMKQPSLRIAGMISIRLNYEVKVATIEWNSGPNEDAYVDMLIALLTKYNSNEIPEEPEEIALDQDLNETAMET